MVAYVWLVSRYGKKNWMEQLNILKTEADSKGFSSIMTRLDQASAWHQPYLTGACPMDVYGTKLPPTGSKHPCMWQ